MEGVGRGREGGGGPSRQGKKECTLTFTCKVHEHVSHTV